MKLLTILLVGFPGASQVPSTKAPSQTPGPPSPKQHGLDQGWFRARWPSESVWWGGEPLYWHYVFLTCLTTCTLGNEHASL